MIKHYYQEIPGWFDFQDVYSEAVDRMPSGGTFVEVGNFFGKSLSYLLVELSQVQKVVNVFGVDTFEERDRGTATEGCDVPAACRHNLSRASYPFTIMQEPSHVAAEAFLDESLDYVFIDAAHDYHNVSRDVRSWLPKVKPGGTIAGHDWAGAFDWVKLGVTEFIPQRRIKLQGVSWIHHKEPDVVGSWQGMKETDGPFIYVPYVNNLPLLNKTINSLAGQKAEPIIVHQGKEHPEQFEFLTMIWQLPLRFTSVMNFIFSDAQERKLPYFFFCHSDVEIHPEGIAMLTAQAEKNNSEGKKWGAIFTHYDSLVCFNTAMIADVGCWDESFSWYVADVDYYNRIRWRGWHIDNLPEAIVHHAGSATLKAMSDEDRSRVLADQEWARSHYLHKWGCHWQHGNGRLWDVPYKR